MSTLIVLAHPLPDSLAAHFAAHIKARLGGDVRAVDLYAQAFDPVLSVEERRTYYQTPFDDAAGLQECERLVLVFPTWWFGLPAMLKGWIDRSFLPGVAYDHASDLSALTGRLTRLREVLVVTTLGSPWWVDWLIVRRPVRRALKWGVIKACAPQARFTMLTLYGAEQVSADKVARFTARIDRALEKMT